MLQKFPVSFRMGLDIFLYPTVPFVEERAPPVPTAGTAQMLISSSASQRDYVRASLATGCHSTGAKKAEDRRREGKNKIKKKLGGPSWLPVRLFSSPRVPPSCRLG